VLSCTYQRRYGGMTSWHTRNATGLQVHVKTHTSFCSLPQAMNSPSTDMPTKFFSFWWPR
jgi:hypothetical protein